MTVKISMKKLISIIGLLFCFTLCCEAKVKLPRLISDGMVLQREAPVKIWGWASPKENVTLKFLGQNFKTKADKKGNWEIILPAQEAGGPYEIRINDITIKDILFGDVWLCSGQSNMELPIRRTLDLYADEAKDANNLYIRHFRVPMKYNFAREESDSQGGEWQAVTPANILEFSATAYFFAKDLYEKYNIPIGLINTAIGGTPAEAWISADALKKYPQYETEAKQLAVSGYIEGIQKEEQEKSREWYQAMIQSDKGIGKWHKESVDLSEWSDYYLPGLWKDKDVKVQNAVMWFRKEFDIKKDEAGKPATLRLGYIIDSDSAFVNGQFVGTTGYQYPPRIYNVSDSILKEGRNALAIRIVTNANGGFKEEKPYKIILANRTIDLTGEWKYRIGTEMSPSPSSTFFQYKPGGLYNGMIAPLTNYKVKGIIWYQGESNIGRAKEYESLFEDLINDWRKQRNNPQLPFIYAQLPELNRPAKQPTESGLAELREVQRQALKVPYTGMAVTLGFGEWNDIHPLSKKGVGYLLSLKAQQIAYGDTTIVSGGPQLESIQVEGNSIILTFSSVGSGLYSNAVLEGFSIAGADKKYVWADATVLSKNKVKIRSNQIQNPVSVRYAWADNPERANLKNREGFSASPFQTELNNE